jgi:hypothetical protein
MNKLSAYYACYNNKPATEFVLLNFRKYFPESTICLISDGGLDFTDLAKKYNTYYYYVNNIFNSGPTNIYSSNRMIDWWNRQKLVCDISNSDYTMILEDDVFVQSNFDIEQEFHMKGVAKHSTNLFTNKMIEDIAKFGNINNDYYGMCGGSVYNSKIFKEIYNDAILDIKNNHDNLLQNDFSSYYKLGAVDANITYHFNKRGFSYDIAEWLTEDQNNPLNKPVIHSWKNFYVK